MKTILCYGDSLTWGYTPVTGERYPRDVRWTGIMAQALGPEYEVISEGLNGRTTVFDVFYDPALNGEPPLPAILASHMPLDLVILMLGTNDLQLGRTAWEASRGARKLVRMINGRPECFRARQPRVLLVSPPHVGANIRDVDDTPIALNGRAESLLFAQQYMYVAKREECAFFDAGAVAEPSELDAEHLTAEGNRLLGEAMAEKVKKLFCE